MILFVLFLDINAISKICSSSSKKSNFKSIDLLFVFFKQNDATEMLEKLCELCCTYETDEDIQVLLDNLQSSIPSVRESCILVSSFDKKSMMMNLSLNSH